MTAVVLCSLGSRGYDREMEHSFIHTYKNATRSMFDSVDVSVSMEELNLQWKKSTRKFSYNIPGNKSPPRSILKKSYSVENLPKIHIPKTIGQSRSRDSLNDFKADSPESHTPKSPSKFVSFADDNNLSLCEVKNFVPSCDKINIWSDSASFISSPDINAKKNNTNEFLFDPSSTKSNPCVNELKLCFTEPFTEKNFADRFKHRCVALEKCGTRGRSIVGVVLVKNIEYRKQVTIRYTTDEWKTFTDTTACYVRNSNDIDTDRFSFTLVLPKNCREMEFAVRYNTSTAEFWDNNYNRNYRVKEVDT